MAQVVSLYIETHFNIHSHWTNIMAAREPIQTNNYLHVRYENHEPIRVLPIPIRKSALYPNKAPKLSISLTWPLHIVRTALPYAVYLYTYAVYTHVVSLLNAFTPYTLRAHAGYLRKVEKEEKTKQIFLIGEGMNNETS